MILRCCRCRLEFDDMFLERHHFIPRKLVKMLMLEDDINEDNYRIILCKDCHNRLSEEWKKVFKRLNILIDEDCSI